MIRRNSTVVAILAGSVVLVWALIRGIAYLHDRGIHYPVGLSDFVDTGVLEFKPQTILAELTEGNTTVFVPAATTPASPGPTIPSASLHWGQTDYLRIAAAAHRYVWNAPLDGWNVYGLLFTRACRDDLVGFDFADVTYFRQDGAAGSFTVHEIEIDPNTGTIRWGGAAGFPRPFFGWKSVSLAAMKVAADDALLSAEEHGGTAFRASVGNSCTIHLVLKPNPTGDNNWDIFYSGRDSPAQFEMQVDPYAGT